MYRFADGDVRAYDLRFIFIFRTKLTGEYHHVLTERCGPINYDLVAKLEREENARAQTQNFPISKWLETKDVHRLRREEERERVCGRFARRRAG